MPGCWGTAQSCKAAVASFQRRPDKGPARHLVLTSASSGSETFPWQTVGRALTGTLLSALLTMNGPFYASAVSLSTDLKGQDVVRETLHEAWGKILEVIKVLL